MAANGRLRKELLECSKSEESSGITVQPSTPGNNFELRATIVGPAASVFEGGLFVLAIAVSSEYPFEPPKVKFLTKVWHPNVSSQTGAICLDILKDAWTPAMSLHTTLLSISALLTAAEPSDPQDAVVAKQYIDDRSLYDQTAKYWTEMYAAPASAASPMLSAEDEVKVSALCDMGFPAPAVRAALRKCGGAQDSALELLLSGG